MQNFDCREEIEKEIKIIQNYFKQNNKLLNVFEFGCAATVSNTLMSIPGASAMIDTCFQLYSKDSQIKRYGEFKRSVSKEFTELVLKTEDKANALALSFQLQDTHYPEKMQTHGWVSVMNDGIKTTYHISYNRNHCSRTDILIDIAKDVVKILYHNFIDKNYKLLNVDMIFVNKTGNNEDLKTLFNSVNEDSIIAFNNKGEIDRWETMVRDFPGIILMRGSFNPIHKRHLEVIRKTKEKYPEYKVFLHCSIKRFDKPDLTLDEIFGKINQAVYNDLPIIFTTDAKFNPSLYLIRERYKGEIIFPVGIDTVNRFVDSEVESEIQLINGLKEISTKFLKSQNKLLKEIAEKDLAKQRDKDELMKSPSIFHFGKEEWEKTKFLMFQRKDIKLSENFKYFSKIIDIFEGDEDPEGVSSTKIRNKKNKIKTK